MNKQIKLKMEAILSLPKVLQGIEDIPLGGSPADALSHYKRNVKEFIRAVTAEVSLIIERYEHTIADLKEENQRLRAGDRENTSKELPLYSSAKPFRREEEPTASKFVHSGKRTPNLQMMQTAKSKIFTPFEDDGLRFSAVLSKYKSGERDNRFPVELINPEPGEDEQVGKSRFQVKSNKKKMREQELRSCLQAGRKNMNHTTKRFLDSIGRGQQQSRHQERQQLQINKDLSDSSQSIKKNDSSVLNKSLGNICNSLDNSFISKRARSSKRKKTGDMETEIRRKQKQEEEIAKMMKGKSIKNILLRLRQNVDASPKKAPQIIKSSKLITCGPSKSSDKQPILSAKKNSSKVMINPVPVDIIRKSIVSKRDKSSSPEPTSPAKRPTSILKQSTVVTKEGEPASPTKSILKKNSQILSKSISGISAIEFSD